ncbi:hypothetical protein NHP21005_12850 [Helicobacter sp. NHP21005]|uniref:hypothetical protein n=1 Tax=Helicobacter felistomachi TaxID=3040201 RepID=UPI002573E349|nr:hypothetical protein [Helicobacter sp. NHP21005]BEG57597.1 hypothetical protein NHP21005_12850 [Helicobacter sp. NHP21005]
MKEYEQEKQVYNASILSPQVVYERYTGAKTLNVDTVKGPEGLASSAIGGVGDFGVQPYLINYASQGSGAPSIYTSNDPFALNAWIWPLITVWHEFGHVNGYNHNGDMTYQNGWFGGRDQENPSGPHSEWAWDRFNEGQVQVGTNSLGQAIAKKSGIPIDIQQYGNANPEGGWFLAGMSGLGTAIWGELGQEGKLPIDYSSLPAATPNPKAPPTQPIKPLPPPYTSDATYQQELVSYNAKMAEYETQIAKLEKEGTAFTAPVWFKAYAAAQAKSAEATYNKNLEKAKAKAASIAVTHTTQSLNLYGSTFLSGLQSTLNHSFNRSSAANTSPMVGFDVMAGFQHYFTDNFELSYYGILKYNFGNTISPISQVALGAGSNALFDFYTKYTTLKKMGRVYRRFASSFGMFLGLRALWQGYGMLAHFMNAGNLNLATGFNYRVGHSRYSIGVLVPLIQYNLKVAMRGADALVLKDGASHFNVFFNYGWVF